MRKYEELMVCLDDKDFDMFVSDYGLEMEKNFLKFLESLISEGCGQVQFNRIDALAEFVFIERQGQHFGDPKHFEINKNMASFQEFIYMLSVFTVIKVPFDTWKELVVDVFNILGDLVQKEDLNYNKHPQFHIFTKKLNRILDEVTKDPEMKRKYFDFLNGAL